MTMTDKIIKAQKELLVIFDSIPDPICIIDKTLSIRRLNMAMADIFGLDIKSALGIPCYRYLLGRETPCELCYFKGDNGNLHWLECKFVERPNEAGKYVFELTIYPFPDAGNNNAVFLFKNISDKVKIEKHLEKLGELLKRHVGEKQTEIEKTRRKYEEIIDHMPIGVSILDERRRIMAVNPAFGIVFGLRRGELLGTEIAVLFNEENQDFHSFFRELNMSGAHSMQITHRDKNGTDRELMTIGFLLEAHKSDSHDTVIMIQDITETKKTQRALIESERTAQVLLNATTDLALLIDNEGTIISINESAANLMGIPVDELIGKNAFFLLSQKVIGSRKEYCDEVIRTKKPVRFEDERAGLHLDNSIFPVFNAKGKVDRVAMFSHNITQKRLLMRELISRETYAATGRMSTNLVRELQKRILKVKNNLGILEEKINGETSKVALVTKTIGELDAARNLLEQARNFYVVAKGRREFINLNDLIVDLLPLMESRLRDNNITLKTSLSKTLPNVSIYPAMVKQAVVHLINNADDAMRRGGVVRIITQKRGNVVQLIVADQGVGMDKRTIETVKKPDYMGEKGKVALGLFICKDVMKNNGGHLDIAGVKGEGAKVTLTFPLFTKIADTDTA